ncbi:MAG: helix-turn-helix domain-containing protein [Thermoplasmata archaeon]
MPFRVYNTKFFQYKTHYFIYGKKKYEIKRYISEEQINALIKNEKKRTRIIPRLIFVKLLYRGKSVDSAANEVGVVHRTGYLWLKEWNKSGLEGLMPKFGGGRPSKLTKKQREHLKQDISEGS